jgi:hypothetical protein
MLLMPVGRMPSSMGARIVGSGTECIILWGHGLGM